MPNDWKICRWGDVATLEYGKALSGYGDGFGEYPVFGTNGPIGFHTESLCKQPSVIIGRKGAYRGVHYSRRPFWVIDTAFYLKPKTEMDTRWAYYQLLTQDINAMDSGSAIPSTSRGDFYSLRLQLPPVPEQRAIAHVLGALDDKIELNQRMNETLESMTRALFQSWFVSFDPVRARMEGRRPFGMDAETANLFPDTLDASPAGDIPSGWQYREWGRLITLQYGRALRNYDTSDSGTYPVYGTNGRIGSCETPLCDKPGIIIGRKGAYRGIHFSNRPFFVIDTAFYVEPTVDMSVRWAYYAMGRIDLNNMDSGSAIPSTSRQDFCRLATVFPPFVLQQRWADILTPLWRKQEQNSAEIRTLETLRNALLPKLMSGEVRVRDAEKVVEALAAGD